MGRRIFKPIAIALLTLAAIASSADYRRTVGVRPMGMGGAFASLADDPVGLFWNPSGIADLKLKSFAYDLSQGAFALACPLGSIGVLGLGVMDMHYEDRFLIDSPYNPFGTFLTGDNQLSLALARRFESGVAMGLGIGLSRAADPESLWSINLDLGVNVKLSDRLFAGVSLKDIGGTSIRRSDGKLIRRFDRQILLGVDLIPHRSVRLSYGLNLDREEGCFGAEVRLGRLALRGGLIESLREAGRPIWTAGASIDLGFGRIDYAYVADPGLRYRHMLAVQIPLGVPPPPAPPPIHPSTGKGEPRDWFELRNDVAVRPTPGVEADRPPQAPGDLKPAPSISLPSIEPPPIEIRPGGMARGAIVSPFEAMCAEMDLDPMLVLALIKVESNLDPLAVSPAGAAGLMQLMPTTARSLGLKVPRYRDPKRPIRDPDLDERFDPAKNLRAGMKYLKGLLSQYSGNYVLAICAYNTGPARVKDDVPPIRQTERFAVRVMKVYWDYRADRSRFREDLSRIDRLLRK